GCFRGVFNPPSPIQGGLICRALLATTPDHNVRSFISLAAPQMGQYGDTDYLKWLFPQHMKSNLYRLCYTPLGQGVSICNYWNGLSPKTPKISQKSQIPKIPKKRPKKPQNRPEWKRNLLRIQRLVLIGGPDDGVITPWQSRTFSRSQVFLQDTFGLKSLWARGALGGCSVPGVPHTAWHSHRGVYERCIRPWLT
ncbi:lysosomal thioesterase PPT2, partial [Camarhynchus parvulus]|uniref:lysosomal thioesterase PPT2 n=1 Tax=Geospiza parvula TaxID=87175 RepID=UPI001237CAD9